MVQLDQQDPTGPTGPAGNLLIGSAAPFTLADLNSTVTFVDSGNSGNYQNNEFLAQLISSPVDTKIRILEHITLNHQILIQEKHMIN